MNVQEILNGRTDFEDITECYNMNGHAGSSINSLKWFVENGHKSNRLRNGFKRAKEIAHVIKEYHDGTKKTTSRVKVRTL